VRVPSLVAVRVLPLVLVGGLAGACSSSPPDPRPVADGLAAGIQSGDLAPVPFAGTTPQEAGAQLTTAVQRLDKARATVRLVRTQVAEDEKTATATLAYSWDVDATPRDWTYESTARLVRSDKSWAVQWSPAIVHPDLTPGARLVRSRQQAPRAQILGAGNAVLVTNRPVRVIGIDKTKVPAATAVTSAATLARVVGVDAGAYVARVRAAGAKAFVEAVTLRLPEAAALVGRVDAVPGAVLVEDELPLAPSRGFAAPILGRVGEATKEVVAASAGTVAAGDQVGLSGLQKRYDEQLRGSSGVTIRLVAPTAAGSSEPPPRRELFASEPVAGKDLATTLDIAAQQRAEALLAAVKPASAIVAIRPSTGDVVAAASGPGGGGQSTATVGRYAPGSTFKVATSLALLRAGLTPASRMPCTPRIAVSGKLFTNYSDYPPSGLGAIPLSDALAYSCNTAFISQHTRVTQAALAEAAGALGLGIDQDLGLPAFLGSVPSDAAGTEHAASMIGQGKVLASPLSMAAVAASVVKGATVAPRLVVRPDATAPVPPPKPLTAPEAAQLRTLMRGVVARGSGRLLADVPAPPVGAKTGTAEYGTGSPPRTHAWMIGFRGDLAVAVMVADGESGSKTAGPILEAFLRAVR
jgi:cell division protein FtsI/penicillin-binding protein 2